MIVAKITKAQADGLIGKEYINDNFFNPVQDANNNWIISLQELVYCSVDFANSVELIEYIPVQVEL